MSLNQDLDGCTITSWKITASNIQQNIKLLLQNQSCEIEYMPEEHTYVIRYPKCLIELHMTYEDIANVFGTLLTGNQP